MAVNIGTIKGSLVLEDTEFKEAIKRARAAVKELTGDFRSLITAQQTTNNTFSKFGNAIKKASDNAKGFGNSVSVANTSIKNSVSRLEKSHQQVMKVGATYTKAATEVNTAVKSMLDSGIIKLTEANRELGKSVKNVGVKINKTTGGFNALAGATNGMTSSVPGMLAGLKNLAIRLGLVMTAAYAVRAALRTMIDGFKAVIGHAVELEKQQIATKAVLEGTKEEMAAVAAQARALSKEFNSSAISISKAQEFLAKAGLKANEVLALTPAVLRGAAAAGEDVEKVAKAVTDGMASMGIGAESAADFVDILTQAAILSKADMSDFGVSLKYAGSIASGLGVELKDLTANMMALRNAGFTASEAGSKLRNMMLNLVKPTREGQRALDALNISATTLTTEGITGVVRALEEARDSMTATEFAAELARAFGKQTGPAMAALVKQGTKAIEEQKGQLDEYGISAKTAKQKTDNLSDAFAIFKNRVKDSTAELLEALWILPAWRKSIDLATAGFMWFDNTVKSADGLGSINEIMEEQKQKIIEITAAIADYEDKIADAQEVIDNPKKHAGEFGPPAALRIQKFQNELEPLKLDLEIETSKLMDMRATYEELLEVEKNIEEEKKKQSQLDAELSDHAKALLETREKLREELKKAREDDKKDKEKEKERAKKEVERGILSAIKMQADREITYVNQLAKTMEDSISALEDQMSSSFTEGAQIFFAAGRGAFPMMFKQLAPMLSEALSETLSQALPVNSAGQAAADALGLGDMAKAFMPTEAFGAVLSMIGQFAESLAPVAFLLDMMKRMFDNLITPLAEIAVTFAMLQSGTLLVSSAVYLLASVAAGLLAPFKILIDLSFDFILTLGDLIQALVTYGIMSTVAAEWLQIFADGLKFVIDSMKAMGADIKTKTPGMKNQWADIENALQNLDWDFTSLSDTVGKTDKHMQKLNDSLVNLNSTFQLRRRIAEAVTGSQDYSSVLGGSVERYDVDRLKSMGFNPVYRG